MIVPFTSVIIVAAAAVATPAAIAEKQIMAAMEDSAAGWNVGDLDRFMRIYSDAPGTSFVVKDGIVSGKNTIADRYRPRFAVERWAKRGVLSFDTLRFTLIDKSHALLIARYRLKFTGESDVTGPTTLLFARERGQWRIVADHSS